MMYDMEMSAANIRSYNSDITPWCARSSRAIRGTAGFVAGGALLGGGGLVAIHVLRSAAIHDGEPKPPWWDTARDAAGGLAILTILGGGLAALWAASDPQCR